VSTYARNITRASYVAISPIPEPSTWAMLTLGIPALLATRRFRRRTY
jgi:hypothetical protein